MSNLQVIHENFCGELFIFSHLQILIVGKLFNIKPSLIQNVCENIDVYVRANIFHSKELRHLTYALFVLSNPHDVIQLAFWDTDIFILAIFAFYEFRIQALHYNGKCFIGCNRADRRALLDINRNTSIQWKRLYIIFFQERQRKNIGRLKRNFHNFEFASKCEVPAKNDVEISLSR